MNTFLKANKNLKSQKATVILLSLFLIFFISSIIGIIYSYNKRIFQLAKQERDNYKVFKKQFDELFSNLYMVDLTFQGWQIGGIQNLDLIKIYSRKDSSYTYTYNGNSSNPTIGLSGNIDIDKDTFNLSSSGDANPPINTSFTLPTAELKGERNNTADKLKDTNAVKNEIERKLKKLLGNNIEILEFNKDPNQDRQNNNEIENKIKKGQKGHLKYTVIIQKNIKILQGKKEKEIKPKYQIDLEYEVSIAGNVEVTFPSHIEHTSSTTETIYNSSTGQYEQHTTYYYTNDISMYITATLNSSSNLTRFKIKKIK
jgi:uncharacterized membrane protein